MYYIVFSCCTSMLVASCGLTNQETQASPYNVQQKIPLHTYCLSDKHSVAHCALRQLLTPLYRYQYYISIHIQ